MAASPDMAAALELIRNRPHDGIHWLRPPPASVTGVIGPPEPWEIELSGRRAFASLRVLRGPWLTTKALRERMGNRRDPHLVAALRDLEARGLVESRPRPSNPSRPATEWRAVPQEGALDRRVLEALAGGPRNTGDVLARLGGEVGVDNLGSSLRRLRARGEVRKVGMISNPAGGPALGVWELLP